VKLSRNCHFPVKKFVATTTGQRASSNCLTLNFQEDMTPRTFVLLAGERFKLILTFSVSGLSRFLIRSFSTEGCDTAAKIPEFRFVLFMIPIRMYMLAFSGIGVAFAGYALLRRKPKTAEEVERARRDWLNSIGRITDGTVIDVQEIVPEGGNAATMLIYQYDVAGVSYEASQDVTYLRQWINLHSCRLGLPTSVKYDSRNPGNSMVISEGWVGLRQ
jgi:hypothetical protein